MMSTIPKFEQYFVPESEAELVQLLAEHGEDAYLLAGGTDLVPKLKARLIRAKNVISLQAVPELKSLEFGDAEVFIGAGVLLADIVKSAGLRETYPVIAEAASHVSSMQVRNVATIGGNTCNASPGADALQGLLAMDATCVVAGPDGERDVPLREFFLGPGKTVLTKKEFLKGYRVKRQDGFKACYEKFAIRGDTDLSIVGAGAGYRLDEAGRMADVRVTMAAVAATPLRAAKAEAFLTGKTPSADLCKEAGDIAAGECAPITDQRATAEYRRQMIAVSVKNALTRLLNNV